MILFLDVLLIPSGAPRSKTWILRYAPNTNNISKNQNYLTFCTENPYFLTYLLDYKGKEDGELLSYLLNSNGVRISHIQAEEGPGFFKTVERYFDTWNMADLTDEGRLMVSLGDGDTADQLLMNLVASSMHNKRTKILVVGGVRTWQDRLLQVTAYEVDLSIVSRESVPAADCPLAIEVLPMGVHGHDHKKCEVLSQHEQNLGHAILKNIRESLSLRRCCSPLDEYTFWKSFPAENGTQRLRPVAVWANDTGLLRMETLDLETITLRVAVVQEMVLEAPRHPQVGLYPIRHGLALAELCDECPELTWISEGGRKESCSSI
ncbi:hypothetical protein AVEN_224469-1 [Araneus ventricosus]|uniref:Uncharacterized protein n=1 Tax=Araneus ventricosus TaxID=182803 RepID=A0A4Y2KJK9_ARAVE|nr:hypothetical protein AVEN_224469-1 [Araneus ventricosus]